MFEPDQDGIYARVGAAASRRITALALLYVFAALLVYLAAASDGALAVSGLLVFGAATLWVAEKMRRSTAGELWLTADAVVHSDGTVLATMDQITAVERGAFAMKPSNGFTLVLNSGQPRAWRPGLWWRLGRRVGVGGIVSAAAAKFMAEQIAFRLATREGSRWTDLPEA